MCLERLNGESDFEYHKRIVLAKLVDKTLSDMDYSELAPLVYGKQYSSDVARRMFYGSKYTLQLMDENALAEISKTDGNSVIKELEQKIVELQKERQRFFDQRREYNKILNTEGRREHLYDRLAESAECLTSTIGRVYDNTGLKEIRCHQDYSEALLVLSDWHYGMKTSNVFNKYDTSICIDRVKSVISGAAQRIALHGCSRLHIVILGDLAHGAIHTSARVASEELVCDQIMQVSELLAQSIEALSGIVPEVCVYITYGNHMRTVQNKGDSIHRDNMERLIHWWIKQRLKEVSNVIVCDESESEFLFINSCGHDICASHGDLDSVKNSPRLLPTLFQKKCGKDIEYILLGDKHHRESFSELGVTSIICGSLCGSDDYANDKRLYSDPSQLLLIVNERDGVDAEYHIKCRQ